MQWLIIGSVIVVVVAGAFIAAWWWKLVANIAPYKDELAKQEARRRAQSAADASVIVLSRPTQPARPGPDLPPNPPSPHGTR